MVETSARADQTPPVVASPPQGWVTVPSDSPHVVLVDGNDSGLGFRSNIVIQEGVWDESLPALVAYTHAQSRLVFDNLRVISVDRIDIHGTPGRLIRSTFRADGLLLVSDRLLAVRHGRALDVNLTRHVAAGHGSPAWLADFANSAVMWDATPDPGDTARHNPIAEEPPRDALASTHYDDDLEDLSIIVDGQPRPSPQLFLSEEAVAALDAAGSDPVADPERKELSAHGFVDDDGRLTDEASALVLPSTAPRIHVEFSTNSRTSHMKIAFGPTFARAVASSSLHTIEKGVDDTLRSFEIVEFQEVPGLVMTWLGINPVWQLPTGVDQLTTDELLTRLDGGPGRPAPEGLSITGRTAWSERWVMWGIQSSLESDPGMEGLTVGRTALHGMHATDDGRLLVDAEPLSPARVWQHLVETVDAALRAR